MSEWSVFFLAVPSFLYYSSAKGTSTEAYLSSHTACVLVNGWEKGRLARILCIRCFQCKVHGAQVSILPKGHFHSLTAGGARLILCSQVGNVNLVNLTSTARCENHVTKSLIIRNCWRSYTASGASSCSRTYTPVSKIVLIHFMQIKCDLQPCSTHHSTTDEDCERVDNH